MDVRYASHPDDVKNYDTETLREKFLIEKVFGKEKITYCGDLLHPGSFPFLQPRSDAQGV